ncbi:MAG: methionine--tRNA ligase subunit beta [Candidatus Paceibacterota bacterium]
MEEANEEKKIETISYDDFAKLDIRIGTILAAESIEGADKLLKLTVDLGAEKRSVCAGIAQFYSPEELVGKQVPILANLAPRTMKGVESQGMTLMAGSLDEKPTLIGPEKSIENGVKVH